jgi:curved DNA-binding protein CbpA
MFLDYYKILEIEFGASIEEIKIAYKKQAIKWHPDKNPGLDTLHQMQLINEAYLILKDLEAKRLYDIEYLKFKEYQRKSNSNNQETRFKEEYVFSDELLKKWMNNARQQAETLAKQTAINFKKGAKAAGKEMFDRTIGFLIVGSIISIFILAAKSCN